MSDKKTIQELFVEEALRQLAQQEAGGFGIALDGKDKKGAPMRVTPSYILVEVKETLKHKGLTLRNASIRDVENALEGAGFTEQYLSGKRFFSL